MILVLTPLAVEHATLKLHFASQLKTDSLQVHIGGHGKVQFALSTQLLIQKYKPTLVICAGAAGGLLTNVKVGDVVVGELTVEHDFNLKFVKRPLPTFPADVRTLEKLRHANQWPDFTVHFGRIASGDEDIVDSKRAHEIVQSTQAMAVAWEGAGGARAAKLQGVPYIEIRGVTDYADSLASESFTTNVQKSLVNVARVIERLSK